MKQADMLELAHMIAPLPPNVCVMLDWTGDRWDVDFDHNGRAYYAIAEPLWVAIGDTYEMLTGRRFQFHGEVRYRRGEVLEVADMQALPAFAGDPIDPDATVPVAQFRVGERSAEAGAALAARPPLDVAVRFIDGVLEGSHPPLLIGQTILRRLSIWLRFLARRDEARARYAAPSPG